jgi:putative transposase
MFSIERSGYYAWLHREPGVREKANKNLDEKIVNIFSIHKSRYGAPRLTNELQSQGEVCGHNRVVKKKYKNTTDSRHNLPISPNLLDRNFTALRANEKWVGDISYVWTDEGWLYLAVVIDLYSRAVIGWSIDTTMERSLVCNALLMALWRRGFPRGMIFHSDRGSQYCSRDYQDLLKQHGITSSMSRKGNCWDNSVSESFFHTIKTELIYNEHYLTRDLAKQSIFQYIRSCKTKYFSVH